ncbi:MAG: hypothetical protein SOI28_10095 [Rahnella inusitata]|jgi:hypothetical protein|uniref:hypothetical protein n=1 Tax=Rahnella rivi TaxID=2816249 RepID=UPI002F3A8500
MKNKSIHARFIRRWFLRFKPFCDSKLSPVWRKHHLKGYIRETALVSAESWLYSMAEEIAIEEWKGMGKEYWTPEFYDWYEPQRHHFLSRALVAGRALSVDVVDECIDEEISCWTD